MLKKSFVLVTVFTLLITTIKVDAVGAINKRIVIGFSQIGTESEWRIAETNSVKEAARVRGIELLYEDGNQKQEKQIEAIRGFIKKKVDVIALAPVVELGWESVLKEAKAAKIPVILMDRSINGAASLYTTCIGPDFVLEGKNACRQLAKFMRGKGDIVEIQGTIGSAAEVNRKRGFRQELQKHPRMKIIKSAQGDFTRNSGYQIMKSLINTYGDKIQALFAHNDDMAIGAIRAIEEYGLRPGKDIKIISIDGIRDIFEEMIKGRTNCTVECNPLLGPQLMKAAKDLSEGKKLPKWIKSKEGIFSQEVAKKKLPKRKY